MGEIEPVELGEADSWASDHQPLRTQLPLRASEQAQLVEHICRGAVAQILLKVAEFSRPARVRGDIGPSRLIVGHEPGC